MQKNNLFPTGHQMPKQRWQTDRNELISLIDLNTRLRSDFENLSKIFYFFSCNLLIFPSHSFFLIRGKAVRFSSISLASCYFYCWLQLPIWTLSMSYSFLDSHRWIFLTSPVFVSAKLLYTFLFSILQDRKKMSSALFLHFHAICQLQNSGWPYACVVVAAAVS